MVEGNQGEEQEEAIWKSLIEEKWLKLKVTTSNHFPILLYKDLTKRRIF